MTRIAAITPAHRAHLRELKTDFDAAYADIGDVSDRSSEAFRDAEARYRRWIKAIDAHALALLDDLDAFELDEESKVEPAPEEPRYSGRAMMPFADIDHVFAEMDDIMQAQHIVRMPDEQSDNPF